MRATWPLFFKRVCPQWPREICTLGWSDTCGTKKKNLWKEKNSRKKEGAKKKTSYVQVFARVSRSYMAYMRPATSRRAAEKKKELSPKFEDETVSERNPTSKRKKKDSVSKMKSSTFFFFLHQADTGVAWEVRLEWRWEVQDEKEKPESEMSTCQSSLWSCVSRHAASKCWKLHPRMRCISVRRAEAMAKSVWVAVELFCHFARRPGGRCNGGSERKEKAGFLRVRLDRAHSEPPKAEQRPDRALRWRLGTLREGLAETLFENSGEGGSRAQSKHAI